MAAFAVLPVGSQAVERISVLAKLAIPAAAVALALGGAASESAAASRVPAERAAATSYAVPGQLSAVIALSPANAWAAGNTASGYPLLIHWNGRTWSKWPLPTKAQGALTALAGTSASDIWAVGSKSTGPHGSHTAPLVLHFNGKAWSQQTSGIPTTGGLYDVSAAGNTAWAVGATNDGDTSQAIFLHLVKGRWQVVPVALGVGSDTVNVLATGPSTALALADDWYDRLVLRWTGRGWARVTTPLGKLGRNAGIETIGAGHAGTVWAVGINNGVPVSMLWNGKAWKLEPVDPAVGDGGLFYFLSMVRPIPGGTEWAVGTLTLSDTNVTLIEYWTGKSWVRVPSPNGKKSSSGSSLSGVAAVAKNNAWAVGSGANDTLILHWNGKTWS
jgi:hypothetical protein